MYYCVWDLHLNKETFNFGGSEWVVDGELGRNFYPGEWPKEKAVRYYKNGWNYDHKEDI